MNILTHLWTQGMTDLLHIGCSGLETGIFRKYFRLIVYSKYTKLVGVNAPGWLESVRVELPLGRKFWQSEYFWYTQSKWVIQFLEIFIRPKYGIFNYSLVQMQIYLIARFTEDVSKIWQAYMTPSVHQIGFEIIGCKWGIFIDFGFARPNWRIFLANLAGIGYYCT